MPPRAGLACRRWVPGLEEGPQRPQALTHPPPKGPASRREQLPGSHEWLSHTPDVLSGSRPVPAAAVAALPQSLVRGTCERRALSPASLSPRPAGSPQGGWGSRAGHLSRPRSSGRLGAPAALGGCGVCAGRGVPGALRRARGGRGVGAARPPCTLQAPLSAGGLVLRWRRPLTLSWS